MDRERLDSLSERVIGSFFEVSNSLGAGFLEKVYERALIIELGLLGIRTTAQVPVQVSYKGRPVGDYFVDLLVEDALIVEVKCVECLTDAHRAQCLNYLKASGLRVGLVVNFSRPKVEWRRVVLGF